MWQQGNVRVLVNGSWLLPLCWRVLAGKVLEWQGTDGLARIARVWESLDD